MRCKWMAAPRMARIAGVAVLALGASGAWAQQPASTIKVAVVDMQSALVRTKEGQKASADLKAKFSPKEEEFQKRQQELQTKQDDLRKKENTLSDEQKTAMQNDIQTLSRNLQRDMQDAQQDVQQEEQLVLGGMSQKMQQVLNKYAADHGITLIFDVGGQSNNLLFASTAVDITNEIVVLYDQAAPVTPPARTTTTSAPKPAAPAPATRTTTPAPRPAAPAPGK